MTTHSLKKLMDQRRNQKENLKNILRKMKMVTQHTTYQNLWNAEKSS